MTEHEPNAKFQRAFDEWRSECSCGWVGSYWKSKARAELEADMHAGDAETKESS